MAPLVSHVKELGLIEAVAYHQTKCFEAGVQFARVEGILPAPEANHAVRGAIDEAIRCREEGTPRTILFNLCGHGHFDMQAYMDHFAGKLEDRDYDPAALAMALSGLPAVRWCVLRGSRDGPGRRVCSHGGRPGPFRRRESIRDVRAVQRAARVGGRPSEAVNDALMRLIDLAKVAAPTANRTTRRAKPR
jgi:hypothetical protein